MRKISPEAFDLSLSRGQSPNPFMATLSSGAITSQPQSLLPPLPQQWSVPPPLLQQQSPPPPPPQQQSAFLPHQWSALPPQQQSVPLPLFLEAEPDHVDALGLDDEGVLASTQTCSDKWLGPDGPQEQPLSTPRVDVEFADLGEVHDHCNIDEEEVTLEGGHFSKEEHAGIDEIYLGATSATSTTAPSLTGLGYNPSILEGLGALLVDALQRPWVSMANNEAGPSTHPYAGLNPTSGLEMWSMTDAEFQSLLNVSAHGSVAPLDGSAFLDPFAFFDNSSPFLPFP